MEATDRLIWQQEDSMANGGILSGNIITNNQFFPTIQNSYLSSVTLIFDNVVKFATYDLTTIIPQYIHLLSHQSEDSKLYHETTHFRTGRQQKQQRYTTR